MRYNITEKEGRAAPPKEKEKKEVRVFESDKVTGHHQAAAAASFTVVSFGVTKAPNAQPSPFPFPLSSLAKQK